MRRIVIWRLCFNCKPSRDRTQLKTRILIYFIKPDVILSLHHNSASPRRFLLKTHHTVLMCKNTVTPVLPTHSSLSPALLPAHYLSIIVPSDTPTQSWSGSCYSFKNFPFRILPLVNAHLMTNIYYKVFFSFLLFSFFFFLVIMKRISPEAFSIFLSNVFYYFLVLTA